MSIYTDRVASNPGLGLHVTVVGVLLFVASVAGLVTGSGLGVAGSVLFAFIGLILVRQARSAFHVRIENDKLTLRFLWIDQQTLKLSEESEFGYGLYKIPWARSGSSKVVLYPLARRFRMGKESPAVDAMLREFGLGDEVGLSTTCARRSA